MSSMKKDVIREQEPGTIAPSKKLNTTEAAIKTATIEVKVLQIGNRQLTIAVFDQLMEEPIIDPDTGKLCGTPWGRVNRHTECKEPTRNGLEHLHIIWQKGSELRKAIAAIPWTVPHYQQHPNQLPKALACSYFQQLTTRNELAELWIKARVLSGERINYGTGSEPILFNIHGYCFEVKVGYSTKSAALYGQEHHLQAFRRDLTSAVGTVNVKEVGHLLMEEVVAVDRLRSAWEKSYKHLERLDQLFIAV